MDRTRVLLVDGYRESALVLAECLTLGGFTVSVEFDGERALARARAERPGSVILELGLEKHTGFEVCRDLRREHWGKDLLLIAYTGSGRAGDREVALAAGFDHFVRKPAPFQALMELLGSAPAAEPGRHVC
jgi:CheY-like chemotaxis protein